MSCPAAPTGAVGNDVGLYEISRRNITGKSDRVFARPLVPA
ncbi:hypothetical protein [Rhizobium phaseoli]|nr:hypothetical protein [Rhizobium phaseoli]